MGRPRGLGLDRDPTLARLARVGCHAMAPGNHEALLLSLGPPDPPVPMVCANLRDRTGATVFPPSRVFGRVGVIGVTTPYVKFSARAPRRLAALMDAFLAAFTVTDPFAAAREEALRLRPLVDTVVLLSHLGERGDARLARAVPEADVILGAHTHGEVPPRRMEGLWYAQAGDDARFAGVYEWDGERLGGGLVPLAGSRETGVGG